MSAPKGKLADHRHHFDQLIEAGREPADAACTYEYHCEACNTHTYVSTVGGTLDSNCQPGCRPCTVHIYCTLAGERWTLGTVDQMAGTPTNCVSNGHNTCPCNETHSTHKTKQTPQP